MKKILFIVFILLLTGCKKEDITTELSAGYDILGLNTEWVDEGCLLNVDNVVYDMDVVSNDIDLTTIGEYSVLYELDYEKETYTCIRIVKVIDDIPPVGTLYSGIDTIILGETWEDAGVNVTDNYDSEVTIVVTGTVDTSTVGTYEIIYTITDSSENQTIITRIVNVI